MKTESKPGWVPVKQAAEFLGMTQQGIRASYVPMLADDDVDRTAKPMLVHAPAILEIYTARQIDERLGDLRDASDSPALERYRLAKAKHAELDLHERAGDLIDRAKCRDTLSRWASLIRRMGEVLAKRHGTEAAKTVNQTLTECRAVIAEFGTVDDQ